MLLLSQIATIVVSGILFTATSAYGEVSRVWNGKTTTYKAQSETNSENTELRVVVKEIKPYGLEGAFEQMPGLNCDDLFDSFDNAINLNIPANTVWESMASCGSETEFGPATAFSYTYFFEAKTLDDVADLDSYIADLEGADVEGEILHFRKVFGILTEISHRFFGTDSNGNNNLITSFGNEVIYANRGEVQQRVRVEADAMESADVNDYIEWIEDNYGTWWAKRLHADILPQTVKMWHMVDDTVIFEDRTFGYYPSAFAGGYRDCSGTTNGFCL
jgi:hypothetical protein